MTELDLSGLDILLVEDDPMLRKRAAALLERLSADVSAVDTLAGARRLIATMPFDFAVLDVNLPDGLGTDLLKEKIFSPDTAIIVVTAHGGVAGAVEAMRLGAADYLVKPFETAELPLVLERARRFRQTARIEEHRRSDRAKEGFFFGNALKPLEAQLGIILVADQRMGGQLPPVLVQGETGTGKTALARWLHEHGPRAGGELVEVNCSALPETLAESELFGHERGAFTDARTTRMGLFEAAQGGTLFLDELPSLSLALQAKVLTAIEDHKIRRVGGNKPIPVDARIIAATQHDLQERAAQGLFREDLFHRLDLYRVAIPPLRERGEDIVILAEWFLRQLAHKHRLAARRLSAIGRARLLSHHWPGNVRELAHELERGLVFEEGDELNFPQLPGSLATLSAGQPDWLKPGFSFPESGFLLEESINRFLQLALAQSGESTCANAATMDRYITLVAAKENWTGTQEEKQDRFQWLLAHRPYFFTLVRAVLRQRQAFAAAVAATLKTWEHREELGAAEPRGRFGHGVALGALRGLNAIIPFTTATELDKFEAWLVRRTLQASREVQLTVNVNSFWTDVLSGVKTGAFGETPAELRACFKVVLLPDAPLLVSALQQRPEYVESRANLGRGYGWKSYRLFFTPGPVIDMLRRSLRAQGKVLQLEQNDLRAQMKVRSYWVDHPGADGHKQRFGYGVSGEMCWAVDVDRMPGVGLNLVADEEFEAALQAGVEEWDKPWEDPRQGDIFLLIHQLLKRTEGSEGA